MVQVNAVDIIAIFFATGFGAFFGMVIGLRAGIRLCIDVIMDALNEINKRELEQSTRKN